MSLHRCSMRAAMLAFSLSLVFLSSLAESTTGLWSNATISSAKVPSLHSLPSDTSAYRTTSSDAATSHNVGDFVAAGLGMSRSDGTSVSQAASEGDAPMLTTSSSSAEITAPRSGNYTLSFTGDCWQQWSSYWSANSSASDAWTRPTQMATSLFTNTVHTWFESASTSSETTTVTVKNGAFAQTTFTTVTTLPVITKAWEGSAISTSTGTMTRDIGTSIDLFGNGTLLKPTCVLPSFVPDCQSSWENWVSGKYASRTYATPTDCTSDQYKSISLQAPSCQAPLSSYSSAVSIKGEAMYADPPSCTQAAVTGTMCSTLVNEFLDEAAIYMPKGDGFVANGWNKTTYVTTYADSKMATITSNIPYWDPKQTFAPGCTLGCHSCQINGGTVQLIYWPPASSTWINGNYSAITDNSTDVRTIVTLGTTLTSPTVYVSFDSLYARDSCSSFGKTYYNEIVAITNTANLSSLYGYERYNGLAHPASFNFTDLYVSPVPDYIYHSQPRCASSEAMFDPRRGMPLSRPANWTCPRTAPYDPILSIPEEVRHIDPGWAKCVGGIDGTYDPPIALTPADAIVKPTAPGGVSEPSSDAEPASSPQPTLAPVTPTAGLNMPSPTPSPEDKPESSPPSLVDDSSQVDDESDSPTAPATQPAVETSHDPAEEPEQPSKEAPGKEDPVSDKEPEGQVDRTSGNVAPTAPGSENKPAPERPTAGDSDEPAAPEPTGSKNEAPEPFTGVEATPTTDALSILSEAKSSLEAATGHPSNDELPQSLDPNVADDNGSSDTDSSSDNSDKPQDAANDHGSSNADSSLGAPDKIQDAADPTTVSLAGGGSATIYEFESSIIVAQDGLSAGADRGSEVTIGTHVFSAASDGNAVVVDSSATHAVPSAANQPPAIATFSVDGQIVSAAKQGSAILIADATQVQTAQAGDTVTVGTQVVKIDADGSKLELGSTTLAIPNKAGAGLDEPIAVWTSGSSTYTAVAQDESIVIFGPDTTATLAPGAATNIAGQAISVPASGNVVVHGDSTATFDAASSGGLTTTVQDAQELIVTATDGSVVVQQGSTSVTLAPGQQTVVQGNTFSAVRSGDGVVVNGSETLSLPGTDASMATTSQSTTSSQTSSGDAADDAEEATGRTSASSSASETDTASSSSDGTHVATLSTGIVGLAFAAILGFL